MKVLVTGGAGFIGSHIVERLLKENHEVRVLDNMVTGLGQNLKDDAEFIQGSVAYYPIVKKSMEDVQCVFHVAGQASTIASFDRPDEDFETNAYGTLNVVKAMLEENVKRIIFTSSMTIYGLVKEEDLPVKEEHSLHPISPYGATKLFAERLLFAYGANNKIKPFVIRGFNVYGPRQRLDNPEQGVLGIFMGNVLKGQKIKIYGDGKQTRDFIHIDDTLDLMFHGLETDISIALNGGTGNDISINDLAKAVQEKFGKHVGVEYFPPRIGDQRYMVADTTKAKDILNWRPKTKFSEGLDSTIKWVEGNYKSGGGNN